MKKIILFLLVIYASVNATAVENFLNTNETLKLDNTEYTLGWSLHPREFQYLQEYFPKGQSPDKFNDMLSVWLFVGDFSAKQFIQNMANSYEARKNKDKSCHYQTYENDGEYMFDCLRSESDGGNLTAIEFNVYRCKDVVVNGKKTMLICFYTRQAKGDDIMPFLTELKERRIRMIKAIMTFEYPKITLK